MQLYKNLAMDKKKKNRYRMVTFLFVLVWMGVIFGFSAQTGEESSKLSNTFIIRKAAHMSEYAALCFLIYLHLLSYQLAQKNWKIYSISWAFTVLYAAADEFHQLFVPGRSGRAADIMIDASGALLCILALYLIRKLWLHRMRVKH